MQLLRPESRRKQAKKAAGGTESPSIPFLLSMPVPGLHDDATREGLSVLPQIARPPQH